MNNQNIILESNGEKYKKSLQKIKSQLIRLLCHINKRFIMPEDTCRSWGTTIDGAKNEINNLIENINSRDSNEKVKRSIYDVYGYIEDESIKEIAKEDHCKYNARQIKTQNMMKIHLDDIISSNKNEFLNNFIIQNEINYLNAEKYDNPQNRDIKYYKTHII